jgi:hypothetical protein
MRIVASTLPTQPQRNRMHGAHEKADPRVGLSSQRAQSYLTVATM